MLFKPDHLPHWMVQFVFNKRAELQIQAQGVNPDPFVSDNDAVRVVILGNPILNERIDKPAVAQLLRQADREPHLADINGEFLLLVWDKRHQILQIISDRFSSIPFYYVWEDAAQMFTGSVYYTDLWLSRGLAGRRDPYAFLEFMWFQRLLGTKTFDTASRCLSAASVLTVTKSGCQVTRYWRPSFIKTTASFDACADEYVRLLQRSLALKTSDAPRLGLMLSGGHDSRMVLACMPQAPVCFTLAVSENTEFQVAGALARMKNAKHVYLNIPLDKYAAIFDDSVRLGGGMYVYEHALFLGYGAEVRQHADVVLHGHGLDYMFQGMYVPVTYLRILGKRTYIPDLLSLPDAANYYRDNISYRLKNVDFFAYLKPHVRIAMLERLDKEVASVIEGSGVMFPEERDKFEYLLNHCLSRHYSNTNVASIRTYAQQRTPAFENDIYNFYLSLPYLYRMGGRMARAGLIRANRQMAEYMTANLKMRACSSPREKTFMQFLNYFLMKTRIIRAPFIYPGENERTWPNRGTGFATQGRLQKALSRALVSEHMESLGLFDMDLLRRDVNLFLQKPELYGQFLATLSTTSAFLDLA